MLIAYVITIHTFYSATKVFATKDGKLSTKVFIRPSLKLLPLVGIGVVSGYLLQPVHFSENIQFFVKVTTDAIVVLYIISLFKIPGEKDPKYKKKQQMNYVWLTLTTFFFALIYPIAFIASYFNS